MVSAWGDSLVSACLMTTVLLFLTRSLFSVWSKTTTALEVVLHGQRRAGEKRVWKTSEEASLEAMHTDR